MKRLEKDFKKGIHKFELIDRNENAAIYQKYIKIDNDWVKSTIEVFKIFIRKPIELNGHNYPEMEIYPSNEHFGKIAWSFPNNKMENVLECFNLIKNKEDKIEAKHLEFFILDYKIKYYIEKKACFVFKNGKMFNDTKSVLVGYYCGKFNKTIEKVKNFTITQLCEGIFKNEEN